MNRIDNLELEEVLAKVKDAAQNGDLQSVLERIDHLQDAIVKFERQKNFELRELAMNQIDAMSPDEFDARCQNKSGFGGYVIPDFPRATIDDEDYPSEERQTCHQFKKSVHTPEQIEAGHFNYAFVHKHFLRHMSTEDFVALAYDEFVCYEPPPGEIRWIPMEDL